MLLLLRTKLLKSMLRTDLLIVHRTLLLSNLLLLMNSLILQNVSTTLLFHPWEVRLLIVQGSG